MDLFPHDSALYVDRTHNVSRETRYFVCVRHVTHAVPSNEELSSFGVPTGSIEGERQLLGARRWGPAFGPEVRLPRFRTTGP